jgi:hypothetical protein
MMSNNELSLSIDAYLMVDYVYFYSGQESLKKGPNIESLTQQ